MIELGSVLVIAKSPAPGRVKTRLAPTFGLSGAAELAAAALADTFAAVRAIAARRHVLVLDGAPGPWIPPWLEVIPQSLGGLDLRVEERGSAEAWVHVEGGTLTATVEGATYAVPLAEGWRRRGRPVAPLLVAVEDEGRWYVSLRGTAGVLDARAGRR